MEHLNDFETAQFIDGFSTDSRRTIEHLNKCEYCFELVCSTMELMQENAELCEELNSSFKKYAKN